MRNSFIRGLTGSAVILLAALVFVLALQGYKALVPVQVEHNTSNVTQAEYDKALARWKSQNVGTYELTVADSRQEIRLRVNAVTGQLYLLSHTVLGLSQSVDGLKAPLSGVALRAFEPYTIKSWFEAIQQDLLSIEGSAGVPAQGATTRYIDLDVAFDPVKGYPTQITESRRTTLGTKEITWRSTAKHIEIKDFAVIP